MAPPWPGRSWIRSSGCWSPVTLFNGKSVFGVTGSAGRNASAVRPHTVIVDDAHACLNKVEQAFRLTIRASPPVYDQVLELYAEALETQAP